MKKNYALLLIIIPFLLLSGFTPKNDFIHSDLSFNYTFRNYSDKQIEKFVREVFANHADDLVLNSNSRRLSIFKDFLSRFNIEYHPEYNGKGFKKLSEIDLNNKYNQNLTKDVVLDIENFNPLKYNFDMLSKKKQFLDLMILII